MAGGQSGHQVIRSSLGCSRSLPGWDRASASPCWTLTSRSEVPPSQKRQLWPKEGHFLFVLLGTGLLCHLDDACISNPCHKGALCDTNPLNGQYICTCPQGYKGADCTEDVDECTMGEFAGAFPSRALPVELGEHLN